MTHRTLRLWAALFILALAVLVGLRWSRDSLALAPATSVTPRSLSRDLEPVAVTGAGMPLLQGAPADDLFVYAYRGGN